MNRTDFMTFFRSDAGLNALTPDDRLEIFSQVLLGDSDITAKLLNDLLADYGAKERLIVLNRTAFDDAFRLAETAHMYLYPRVHEKAEPMPHWEERILVLCRRVLPAFRAVSGKDCAPCLP